MKVGFCIVLAVTIEWPPMVVSAVSSFDLARAAWRDLLSRRCSLNRAARFLVYCAVCDLVGLAYLPWFFFLERRTVARLSGVVL